MPESRKLPVWLPYAVLALAVATTSTASILVRLAQAEGVHSLTIAAWRLIIAAAVLTPLVGLRARPALAALPVRDWLIAAASGLLLALHFAAWISSLSHTSVANSTVLVCTSPLWIALFAWLVFGQRPGAQLVAGIAIAMAGCALLFLAEGSAAARVSATAQSSGTLGNVLALAGSLAVCGYLLIGNRLRARLALLPYIWLVYATAALALVLMALAAGTALAGFSALAWAAMAAMALGPQLLGHSGYNWALKHVSASLVAVTALGEPIGAAWLAWWLFDERFTALQLAGFALILAGIFLAALAERAKRTVPIEAPRDSEAARL